MNIAKALTEVLSAFWWGFWEGKHDYGRSYGTGPTDPRNTWYDWGRNLRRRDSRGLKDD